MITKTSLPNIVTLCMGFIASISILLISLGHMILAIRLVFIALSLDVLDGYLARRFNATSEKGALLDRLFDRLYQVIIPVILYVQLWPNSTLALIYGAVLITVSFWRIAGIKAGYPWFVGLPLNIHTLVIISSILGNVSIPPLLMILSLIPTILPIKYVRKIGTSTSDNRGTFWQARLVIPLILAFLPYGKVSLLFKILMILASIYVFVGWIPLYMNEKKQLLK